MGGCCALVCHCGSSGWLNTVYKWAVQAAVACDRPACGGVACCLPKGCLPVAYTQIFLRGLYLLHRVCSCFLLLGARFQWVDSPLCGCTLLDVMLAEWAGLLGRVPVQHV